MGGKPVGWTARDEREHFIHCPVCGKMLDMRDLAEVISCMIRRSRKNRHSTRKSGAGRRLRRPYGPLATPRMGRALTTARCTSWSALMDRISIYDELSRVERDVVAGERQLAEQERLVLELKRQGENTANAEAELERLRECQRHRDQDRQRLLSLLQP